MTVIYISWHIIAFAVTVEKSVLLTDWKVQCYHHIVMLTNLWNMIFNLPTDGFIQCPLSKFIHHEMAFWSSNFLLQQVPASKEPIQQPNSLQWTIDSIAYTKPTFAALGVRASAYCYQEQGEFHHSHSNPPASTDARGPLKCDWKHLGTSEDDVSPPKYIIWSPFLTFRHFATSKMNSANDSESKAR